MPSAFKIEDPPQSPGSTLEYRGMEFLSEELRGIRTDGTRPQKVQPLYVGRRRTVETHNVVATIRNLGV